MEKKKAVCGLEQNIRGFLNSIVDATLNFSIAASRCAGGFSISLDVPFGAGVVYPLIWVEEKEILNGA